MLKRTKSYLLLTLVVLTGFAGSVHNGLLTARERRTLVHELKETRKIFLHNIEGLSENQMNFKPEAGAMSINDCISTLITEENETWNKTAVALNQPAQLLQRGRSAFTDEAFHKLVLTRSINSRNSSNQFFPNNKDAVSQFRSKRKELLKFVNTTTDDLRSQEVMMPIGKIDAFQAILLLTIHTNTLSKQISAIKAHPAFPRQ